jgi:Polyketide cyclase / dehydrase and lipid transport
MSEIVRRASISAPLGTVFEVLSDHRRYTDFLPVRSARLEREGVPAPNGVGAVRALRLIGPPIREEVTVYEPPRRFAYKLLSGLPMRDYHAEVVLAEGPGGSTNVIYRVSTGLALPAPDSLALPIAHAIAWAILRGVKRQSESRGSARR